MNVNIWRRGRDKTKTATGTLVPGSRPETTTYMSTDGTCDFPGCKGKAVTRVRLLQLCTEHDWT